MKLKLLSPTGGSSIRSIQQPQSPANVDFVKSYSGIFLVIVYCFPTLKRTAGKQPTLLPVLVMQSVKHYSEVD